VTTPKVIKALHEEAAVMFRMNSPYTVKLHGVCSDDNETSLVMERMTGGSLFHLLQDESKELPWTLRYRLAYEIAEGLWTLHAQEILHRDLKSLNVLLDGEQHAKVTDFGFSKLRGQVTSVAPSSSKQSLGTPAYKSPEIVECDLADSDSDEEGAAAVKKPVPYTPYSDVYAYGVILWELATRKIPFAGQEPIKVYKKIAKGKHEKIPDDCPPEFAALIKKCWAMQPGQRPRTDAIVAQTKASYEATMDSPAAVVDEKEEAYQSEYMVCTS
jgi:serine/threonine protein kinase